MTTADTVFRAIAHPARREMISLLAVSARSVKELTAEFEMSQPAVSQHLKELKEAKLVASERVGLEQHYRLTPRPLRHVLEWSETYRTLVDPAGHVWTMMPATNEKDKVKIRKNKARKHEHKGRKRDGD